jgi:hypothetical protein
VSEYLSQECVNWIRMRCYVGSICYDRGRGVSDEETLILMRAFLWSYSMVEAGCRPRIFQDEHKIPEPVYFDQCAVDRSVLQRSKCGPLNHFEWLEDFLIFRESCLVESIVIIIPEASRESCNFGQSYVERN